MAICRSLMEDPNWSGQAEKRHKTAASPRNKSTDFWIKAGKHAEGTDAVVVATWKVGQGGARYSAAMP